MKINTIKPQIMKKLFYFILFTLSLFVNAQPPSIVNPTPLQVCDINNNGFASFDLTSKNAEILGSLNPNEYSVSYHLSYSESILNWNMLPSPYTNILQDQQTVYVKVQSNADLNSYAITTLQLIVSNAIPINSNIPIYRIFENPFDGVAFFDLTSQNEFITTNSNYQIVYFTSQADAESLNNPVANPTEFIGNNLQTIWFRVTGNVSNCFAVGSYMLKVFDSSLVVNIPDPIFKARLLASSTTSQVAGIGANIWFSADANSDGEIQVSEALEITFLRLGGWVLPDNLKINSLEGINSFSNLIHLECENNLLQTLNLGSLPNLFYLSCGGNNLTSLSLQNFPNLEILYCGVNPLSSLNFQSLPNLKTLNCFGTLLTSLDVTPFTNLTNLSCNNSQLTSLNVTGMANLGSIECDFNQLTTVDFQGLNSLSYFTAINNQITSLNLQDAPNLGNVILNNNLLTSLNVEGLNFLNSLECNNNLFTTLSIESVTDYFQVFRCSENSLLETLFIKNGLDEFIWAANCPNLEYVCADESQIPSILTGFAGISTDCVVNTYCTFLPGGNYNSITGKILFDANSNGCDVSDLPQPNIRIDINDGINQGATFSSFTGNYGFYTQEGNFSVTPSIENPAWFTISPSVATIPFPDANNNAVIQDFCIAPNGFHPDLEIVIAPIFQSRPGQDAVYQIVYKNKGNQTLSQVDGITLNYNNNLMEYILSTQLPSANNLGQLKWSYANLIPFESRSFAVTFNINSTTDTNPVNGNDVLQFTTSIEPVVGDETVSDNTFVYNETVVDFFITNSITCVEGPNASTSSIGEYLHYIINFENIGADTADNIVLRMDIDETQFDIATLQILNASHDCYSRISGNVAEFILQNVMLDTGGHGNILLKIKTTENLLQGSVVSNQARMFFDYNFPLETNKSETLFQALSIKNPIVDKLISIYPNPVKDFVNIAIKENSTIKSIELYDSQGRLLYIQMVNTTSTELNLAERASGLYFVKINTDLGSKVEKLVKE